MYIDFSIKIARFRGGGKHLCCAVRSRYRVIDEDLRTVLTGFVNQEGVLVQRARRSVHHRDKRASRRRSRCRIRRWG